MRTAVRVNLSKAEAEPVGEAEAVRSEPSANRRHFLAAAGGLGGIGAAVALGVAGSRIGGGSSEKEAPPKTRFAMVIDLRRCTGCRACAVACKAENNVPLGSFRSYVSQIDMEDGRNVARHFVPRLCNHCKRPACIKVCPVEATYKQPDGAVLIRKERCIGCRYCVVACPYGARSFQWHREKRTDGLDWPARKYGVADKCDLCVHRVTAGVAPACVNTCPAKARIFGDLNDPDSEVAKIVLKEPVSTLAPELGTEPSVFYVNLHYEAAQASLEAESKLDVVHVKRGQPLEV